MHPEYRFKKYIQKSSVIEALQWDRYGLENPFIFSELTGLSCKKTPCQVLKGQIEITSQYYNETFTLNYIKKIASYMMKKRKGTKKYKERLYRSGSLAELQEVVEMIFQE